MMSEQCGEQTQNSLRIAKNVAVRAVWQHIIRHSMDGAGDLQLAMIPADLRHNKGVARAIKEEVSSGLYVNQSYNTAAGGYAEALEMAGEIVKAHFQQALGVMA